MDFVMVPVPEELVDEVMQMLRWKAARAPVQSIDAAAVARIVGEADAFTMSLLTSIRRAKATGEAITVGDVADILQRGEREVLGTILSLNILLAPTGASVGLHPAQFLRQVTQPDEILGWTIEMPDELAEAVGQDRRAAGT